MTAVQYNSCDSDEQSLLEDEEDPGIPFSTSNLEEDQELLELARHAARSHHQLRGIPYDESSHIDIYNDIKFSVVELKLPLGCECLDGLLSLPHEVDNLVSHISFSFLKWYSLKIAVRFLTITYAPLVSGNF